MGHEATRRQLLKIGGVSAGAWLAGCQNAAARLAGADPDSNRVTPVEDLMREHGVLRRVLLIYDEAIHRLETRADLPIETVAHAAGIVHDFVEDYHEKQEEDSLFPRFEKAQILAPLVATLRAQHEAGRVLTRSIQGLAVASTMTDDGSRQKLLFALRSFGRMYRAHAAREDTVLFPALHKLISSHEYAELGEIFEQREHQMFGGDGFEKSLHDVSALEDSLGLADLARYTPS